MTSAWMIVLPPRIMFVVPISWQRRETLLPVSWEGQKEIDGGVGNYGLLFRYTRPLPPS